MFWTIAAVIAALVMLVLMSKRVEDADDDPVYLAFLDVIGLCDEIARWETNLWSLWTMAVVENLLFRLDESERVHYLYKLENQIIELQQELHKEQPMSEKGDPFPYFAEKTNDLQTH